MTDRARIVTRLEPLGPAPLAEVLAARTADSLWYLARQWQMGELLGEDAGTIVSADIGLAVAPLTHLRGGRADPGWPATWDGDRLPDGVPLDALVEAEPQGRELPLWRRADGGRLLQELAAEAGLPGVATASAAAFPLAAPPADDPDALALWRGVRALADGLALLEALAGGAAPAAPLPRPLPDPLPAQLQAAWEAEGVASTAGREVLAAWAEAWQSTLPLGGGLAAWDAESLTHRFAIAAASPLVTTVFQGDHRGAALDWFDLSQVRRQSGLAAAPPHEERSLRLLPARLRFPGMPAERWWQVDDAVIDLGAVDAGAADVARMLQLDFAVSYGGDAYLVPVRLPAASWTTVSRFEVLDCFGDRATIQPAASAAWAMCTTGAIPGLLLVPSSVGAIDGAPTDVLTLARDELANLAWLIEERWASGSGQPVERATRPTPPPPIAEGTSADLVWRLAADPPPSWFPLAAGSDSSRGPVLRRLGGTAAPRSRLAAHVADPLPDRTLPRSGARVERRARLAVDSAGRPVLWMARRTGTADAAAGASGLSWDEVRVVARSAP
jgi:hypothetical protein